MKAPSPRPKDDSRSRPDRSSIQVELVETRNGLAEKARSWRDADVLGIDTEFVRERTFYPGLGLIQISDGHGIALIDPKAIHDLEPLRKLLIDPGITKIFHACSEDLEVLYHHFETFPRALFDTQIAAALTGLGTSLSYGALVSELFDKELPKGQTRSNWLRRPLRQDQLDYAALDVAYLVPIYRYLARELERLGRTSWHREQVEQLCDTERFLPEPQVIYESFAKWNLSRRELGILRAVSSWREVEARRRDLPRNFVLPKEALLDLARHKPRNAESLKALESLRPQDKKRHGRNLLHLIRQALALPEKELPAKRGRPLDLSPHRAMVQKLRQAIRRRAEHLGIPAETLANRRTAENLVRRKITGTQPAIPEAIPTWRRLILEDLLTETAIT